jgi:hypothetical protein
MARQLQRKTAEIQRLRQQAQAHKMTLEHAKEKIRSLTDQLSQALHAKAEVDPITTPADCIFHDLVNNQAREPNGRRYSRETMIWARQVYDISERAWDIVRKVLPLPSDRLLRDAFRESRSAICHGLLDTAEIRSVLDPWMQANQSLSSTTSVVLAVDAVAFRPLITVHENGTIDGLNEINDIDPDLFDKLVGQPQAFATFLREHWTHAYSSLFVFQIQPLDPRLHCGIIHVLPAINGKGTSEIVSRLFDLRKLLQTEFHMDVCGVAFDGDSCFNTTHQNYSQTWIRRMSDRSDSIPDMPVRPVVICDPLHLLKRIRYRWVTSTFSIGFGTERVLFSTRRIKNAGFLSPIVFLQSRVSKMHDALPVQLFSPLTLSLIFRDNLSSEFIMAPWCLLTAGLTLSGISTRTRIELLEVGFWVLYIYWRLKSCFGYPTGVIERITEGREAALYRSDQLRDALNTFMALILVIRGSSHHLCLNRLGSNPLEHAFGKARTRCRDVNTMAKMLAAFTTEILSKTVDVCLDLATVPHRRISFGLDCAPLSRIEKSIFGCSPKEIAASLLRCAGISLERLDFGLASASSWASEPWRELYNVPEFCPNDVLLRAPDLHDRESAARERIISSNSLFLGVASSTRAQHLLGAHGSMGDVLEGDLEEIESGLNAIFHRRLTNRELELRMQAAIAYLKEDGPNGRSRTSLLHWLRDHWPEAKAFFLRELLGHSQWITAEHSTQ